MPQPTPEKGKLGHYLRSGQPEPGYPIRDGQCVGPDPAQRAGGIAPQQSGEDAPGGIGSRHAAVTVWKPDGLTDSAKWRIIDSQEANMETEAIVEILGGRRVLGKTIKNP